MTVTITITQLPNVPSITAKTANSVIMDCVLAGAPT